MRRKPQPYARDPLTGSSGTRAWVEKFLEAYASPTDDREAICGRIFATTSPPLDVLYPTKSKDPRRPYRYIGRASPVNVSGSNNEQLLCEVADVSHACGRLTDEQRNILYLKYIRDLGDHEIAYALGVSVTTVLTIISDSLDTIAAALDGTSG